MISQPPVPPVPVLLRPGPAIHKLPRPPSLPVADLTGCKIYELIFMCFIYAPALCDLVTRHVCHNGRAHQSHTRHQTTPASRPALIHTRTDHTKPPHTDDTRQLQTSTCPHPHEGRRHQSSPHTRHQTTHSWSAFPHPHEGRRHRSILHSKHRPIKLVNPFPST